MSFKWRNLLMEHLYFIVLIVIPGVCSGDWRVTTLDTCALKGTSVVIRCLYDYPNSQTVNAVGWFKRRWIGYYTFDPVLPPNFEYVGDSEHNCALKIKNIEHKDEGMYVFRFTTYRSGWTSKRPTSVSVRELIASVEPTVVKEGEIVSLTCRSGCITHTNIQSVWFREGQPVNQVRFTATREDSGRYTCALQGQGHVRSQSVSVNVQYAPNNVMLLISPSKDIIQGKAVSFTCSSEANPTVTPNGYKLFKDGNLISSGPSHSISEVQPSDSGQYYCQASNNITWNGSYLFQSTKTRVNVLYPPMNTSVFAELTEVVEGSDVNLTCHSNANPPAVGFTWYRTSSSFMVQMGSGPVLSLSPVEVSSSGLYICQASNGLGENNSTELLLSVKTKYSASSFPILAGICVCLLIAIMLAFLLYWKKRRSNQDKQTTRFSGSPPDDIETHDNIYANVLMFQKPSFKDKADYSSSEEVFYTTVTFKSKNTSRIKKAPEMEGSVIYTEIAKSC